ncbi:hypothetical protein [Nonomuraea soli]|uniref:Uncharacterized protein n=1 Tax=Nonomuraea soli TaxID=1032476 RepID=A0A7W0CH77_9ACTN|nr:hypothetical protein [Nonomuraea soli]MBA2891120.1 hypothetical protein [Nonomuraea soli]NUT41352.1 hypothetical protein [Thermoactinospora sp.]
MGNSNSDGGLLTKPGSRLLEDDFTLTLSEKTLLEATFTIRYAPGAR